MQEIRWLFYKISAAANGLEDDLVDGCTAEFWRPNLFRIRPKGLSLLPFAVWWAFHMLHVFANREYGLLIIRRGGKVIHRSVITPPYFRFPFMAGGDVQVGDTWTDPDERGKGLATYALNSIKGRFSGTERKIWYVVEPENQASIRVVEKAGFALSGQGIRTRRFGLGFLGQFVVSEPIEQRGNDLIANKGAQLEDASQ